MASEAAAEKAALRAAALARRDALAPEIRMAAAARLAEHALPFAVGDLTVAGYSPIRSEMDPRPLLNVLGFEARRIALPSVEDGRLVFRSFAFGDSLIVGPFGVIAPHAHTPLVSPALVLMPLAAFDRRGARIGYGHGFYDAYLGARRAAGDRPIVVGVAFATQEVAAIPVEPHDEPMEFILTEEEVVQVGNVS